MKRQVTHYQLLEVSESASPEMIHAAWKLLMKKYHPDKASGHAETATAINFSYSILSDPQKRAQYDAELRAARTPIPVRTARTNQRPAYPPPYPEAYRGIDFNMETLANTFLQNFNVRDAFATASEAVLERLAQDNPIIADLMKKRRRAG